MFPIIFGMVIKAENIFAGSLRNQFIIPVTMSGTIEPPTNVFHNQLNQSTIPPRVFAIISYIPVNTPDTQFTIGPRVPATASYNPPKI